MFKFFDNVPHDIIIVILKKLATDDLRAVACTSRRFNKLAYNKSLSLMYDRMITIVEYTAHAKDQEITTVVNRIKKLLALGADPNMKIYRNIHEPYLLLFLASQGASNCQAACQAATILLQAGANPNLKNPFDYAPLHISAIYGNAEMSKLLIDNGADTTLLGVNNFGVHNKDAASFALGYGFTRLAHSIRTNSDWEAAFEEEKCKGRKYQGRIAWRLA